MKRQILITQFLICGLAFLCIILYFIAGYKDSKATSEQQTRTLSDKTTSQYSLTTIDTSSVNSSQLVYNPMDDTLGAISHKKSCYSLSTWQPETQWTTGVVSWKIKKDKKLDNFTYNTNGALYACLKQYKKGALQKQSVVRLRRNGKIQKVKLSSLNQLRKNNKRKQSIPEITDIQCDDTSISVTYKHGAMKIYNLAEGQALGAESITGSSKRNVFYDSHYFTTKKESKTKSVLLYNYDIRTGEISHTFPIGGKERDLSLFHLSHYHDTLYLLTPKGIFLGACTETKLFKYLSYSDLPQHTINDVTYFQAARDKTVYIGYQDNDKKFHLQYLTLPPQPQSNNRQTTRHSL